MLSALAHRYARALVDVVTKAGSAVSPDQTTAQLAGFVAAFQSSTELRNVLLSPAVAPIKKRAIIGEIASRLGISRPVQNFLYVVADHRRLNLLGELLAAFEDLLDERLGVVRAEITTAHPVDAGQQDALTARLSEKTGRQVQARYAVDQALLGGVLARIGSTVYDGSVRGQLAGLRRRLGEG